MAPLLGQANIPSNKGGGMHGGVTRAASEERAGASLGGVHEQLSWETPTDLSGLPCRGGTECREEQISCEMEAGWMGRHLIPVPDSEETHASPPIVPMIRVHGRV